MTSRTDQAGFLGAGAPVCRRCRAGQAVVATSDAFPGEQIRGADQLGRLARGSGDALAGRARRIRQSDGQAARRACCSRSSLQQASRKACRCRSCRCSRSASRPSCFASAPTTRWTQVPVRIGARRPGWVEILDGVKAGDRVVVEGIVKLKPGAKMIEAESAPADAGTPANVGRLTHAALRPVDPPAGIGHGDQPAADRARRVRLHPLPLRELPDIDPPVVSISTTYTGASAAVVETRITQVLEDAVSGIEGVDLLTSSSRNGRSSINIEFTASARHRERRQRRARRGQPRHRPLPDRRRYAAGDARPTPIRKSSSGST